MQRRPYNKTGKPATLICSNSECTNVSSKLYIVENKIIEALRIWIRNYEIDCTTKNNLTTNNSEILEHSISLTKKELEKENEKLDKIYSFLENNIYDQIEFKNRSKVIKNSIQNLENKLKEYYELLSKNNKTQNFAENKFYKLNNIIDIYNKLETATERNILLKLFLSKVTYSKNQKALGKDADYSNFELHIYPKLPKI